MEDTSKDVNVAERDDNKDTNVRSQNDDYSEHKLIWWFIIKDNQDLVILEADSNRKLTYKCQVQDYFLRGPKLHDLNAIDYFTNTYKERRSEKDLSTEDSQPFGRPHHTHVLYQEAHSKHKEMHWVVRPENHNSLPNFIGRWLPQNDDPDTHKLYYA